MAVPQALSYAAVAGLSAQYGLYNAFVGLVPYVFFGTSPHLISGPTAVMSLITRSAVPQTWNGDAVLPMTTDPSDMQYARLTFLLAFLAGLIQILLGTFKLGFVINLVSQPVIVGFTSAAAFLIVATQFSSLLGISKCHATAFGSVDVPSLVTMLHKAQADLNPSGTRPAAAQALINATIKALPDAKGKCEFYADVGHVLTHLDEVSSGAPGRHSSPCPEWSPDRAHGLWTCLPLPRPSRPASLASGRPPCHRPPPSPPPAPARSSRGT